MELLSCRRQTRRQDRRVSDNTTRGLGRKWRKRRPLLTGQETGGRGAASARSWVSRDEEEAWEGLGGEAAEPSGVTRPRGGSLNSEAKDRAVGGACGAQDKEASGARPAGALSARNKPSGAQSVCRGEGTAVSCVGSGNLIHVWLFFFPRR